MDPPKKYPSRKIWKGIENLESCLQKRSVGTCLQFKNKSSSCTFLKTFTFLSLVWMLQSGETLTDVRRGYSSSVSWVWTSWRKVRHVTNSSRILLGKGVNAHQYSCFLFSGVIGVMKSAVPMNIKNMVNRVWGLPFPGLCRLYLQPSRLAQVPTAYCGCFCQLCIL